MFRRTLSAISLLALLSACHSSESPSGLPIGSRDEPLPPAPQGDWYGGDTHVHDDHSSDGSGPRQALDQMGPGNVSVADQIGQGERWQLDWMPLTDHRTFTQHYDPLWESSKLLLLTGEEANGSPHSTVRGAVDWVVQGASRLEGADWDRLQTSIWDAHSQGANWSIAHPDDGELEDDGVTPNARASAIGMDLVEAWNRASDGEKELDYVESRWNKGWRFGMAGACDDHFKELWAIAGPGMPTTGVFAPALKERAILNGLRGGRTRIALYPDLIAPQATLEADFQNDGVYEAICGDEAIAPVGTPGKLRIHAVNAIGSTVDLYKSPGRSAGVFQSFNVTSLDQEFLVDVAVEDAPSWYRVEVRGVDQPATVSTGLVTGFDAGALMGLIDPGTITSVAKALRSACSPIFISSAPVDPQPELPLPQDAGTEDGAQLQLGDAGRFAGFPDVAVSGAVTHVVAETHDDAATHVFYKRNDGEAIDLVPGSDSARFPKIAAQGDSVWVAWQDERAGQIPHRSSIYLRHSADGGRSWGNEAELRKLDGRAEHPSLALTPDGLPVVVWQEISAGNPFDVMVQIVGKDEQPTNLSRDGKSIMAANALDTRSARYPASVWPGVTVSADGHIAVAYEDDRTDPDPLWTGSFPAGDSTDVDNWQLRVTTLSEGGWSPAITIGADDKADRHPSIAFAGDGALVLAWDSVCLNSSGCNVEVLSARSTDGGATWSDPLTIAASTVGMSQYPRLGVDPAGAVRTVWYDSRSEDWRWRVMTAVNDALGNWMAVNLVPAKGINTWPATAGGQIVFASTRNALRLQRDRTQQVFLLSAQ